MKIAVSSYSFSKLVAKEGISQLDCIQLAKEIGYDGIEFSGIEAPEGVAPIEYAKQLAEEADKLNFPIVNFCTSANFAKSGKALEEEIEATKAMVDIAAVLGVPHMRHDATHDVGEFKTFDDALPYVAEGCRAVTEYAAAHGIQTMVENHGFIFQDPDRLEALRKAVNHPNFGFLLDMGNFLCGDCDPAYACGRLREGAFFMHAKDFIVKPCIGSDPGEGFFRSRTGNYLRGTIIGHGVVPIVQCLFALQNIGYDDWISVEFEGIEDVRDALRINLDNLRHYIAANQ